MNYKLQIIRWIVSLGFLFLLNVENSLNAEKKSPTKSNPYSDMILKDEPVGYWRFENDSKTISNHSKIKNSSALDGTIQGSIQHLLEGPREPEFSKLPLNNQCIELKKPFGQITISDPGDDSSLDFKNGDGLTIEAWVKPDKSQMGDLVYILGKGRTSSSGQKANNQNYALRLNMRKNKNGEATTFGVSFLFRTVGKKGGWHRWTSNKRLPIGDGWHHVAITYQFGNPKSIRGYLDGMNSKGYWNKEGPTKKEPVVDNDNLLIGSSMNQNPASSYRGFLDEVALYKKALSADKVKARFHYQSKPLETNWANIPDNQIQVEIHEHIADRKSWAFRNSKLTDTFYLKYFTFPEIPHKYSSKGLRIDRSNPILLRTFGKIKLPEGKLKFLVRARNSSRLYIDGKMILETDFHNISPSAHGSVDEKDYRLTPSMPHKTRGDHQKSVKFNGDGKIHHVRFEMIVGGRTHRLDLGETAVLISEGENKFHLLSPDKNPVIPFTEPQWRKHISDFQNKMATFNSKRRRDSSQQEDKKWEQRHSQIKKMLSRLPVINVPELKPEYRENNVIDRFINSKISENNVKQSDILNDLAFLRKLALDTQGTVPTLTQIKMFLDDSNAKRRNNAIERFLNAKGWADHWVSYWQDVLAENPNIIKPTLNNTGPFRWWIHESFVDNKPFDRFVTELIQMEGSKHYGGPAGFELASQNDVPFAAKAHIIGQAFLALNMKCARCHDAPFRDFKQKDLFSIAAMLKRSPQEVPKTSSIPGFDPKNNSMMVNVTLKPGEKIVPNWPFNNITHSQITKPDKKIDSRKQLAELITSPKNKRFSKVIVNRIWKRYLGLGLVEPIDDWTGDEEKQSPLLGYLSRSFMENGYNIKHIARLIFQSDLYQRKTVVDYANVEKWDEPYHFASPVKRRMQAEQIVDSLFKITGKPFNAGQMSQDIDGAIKSDLFTNLGSPTHAWEFSSSSNERDRPSLSLPFAEPFLILMKTFGWRDTRQEPISERDDTSTALQPAIMANGVLSQRFTRCSDDNAFTEIALEKQPLEKLISVTYLKTLTRQPTQKEFDILIELLSTGYEKRLTNEPPIITKPHDSLNRVTWSNHLHARANEIKLELQKIVYQGDHPSPRLSSNWRERYEDVLWAIWNSPEFIYLP